MKPLQIFAGMGGITLVVLGTVLGLTNPNQEAYEQYAVEQLSIYLKDEVCKQAPTKLGFLRLDSEIVQRQCRSLVDTGRPQIQGIISETTERQNWLLFSIYRTDLDINSLLPAYEFETLGVFQKFYTYQAKQQGE